MTKNTVKLVEETTASFVSDVKSYTHQIWLAGLGAYAKAGKDGAEYFKTLVSEGEAAEKLGKELIAARLEAANNKIDSFKEKIQEAVHANAGGRLGKVEQMFDERVATALGRIGIPSKTDIGQLSAKLDDLGAALKSLQNK